MEAALQAPRGRSLLLRLATWIQGGVWRFREGVLNVDKAITHPEGSTRLYERDGMLYKHEGENPTGSFKDRGMTVAVTHAVRVGARAVACASTGHTPHRRGCRLSSSCRRGK